MSRLSEKRAGKKSLPIVCSFSASLVEIDFEPAIIASNDCPMYVDMSATLAIIGRNVCLLIQYRMLYFVAQSASGNCA